jgi:hypothetical protein
MLTALAADFPRERAVQLEQFMRDAQENHAETLKRAVFDYVQRDPQEHQRLAHLRLPPPPQPPPVPE